MNQSYSRTRINQLARLRHHTRGRTDSSARAHHIGIAVAYNAWKFYQVTGDLAYLIDYGTEMLVEMARFWASSTSEGIQLAAMAGSVGLMQRCFTGMETRADRIILSPPWPKSLGVLALPIHYRGLHLHPRVSGKGAIISVDPRGTGGVDVECRSHVEPLTPGRTVRFPA